MVIPWKGCRTKSLEFFLGDSGHAFISSFVKWNKHISYPHYRVVLTKSFQDSKMCVKAFHEQENYTGIRDYFIIFILQISFLKSEHTCA